VRGSGVTYNIAYSLVTVHDGADVTSQTSACALASCKGCTTVAVSFQVVLIVGTSKKIAPINVAEALNGNCPACVTTAIADQIVVTLDKERRRSCCRRSRPRSTSSTRLQRPARTRLPSRRRRPTRRKRQRRLRR
jgi:Na+-translocating ferredoxin:NAD+ oxidoreductase RNF subunit RnfB